MDRHKPDFLLLFTILCLVAIGLVMVYSAGMVNAVSLLRDSPSYYFTHQLKSVLVGLTMMVLAMNIPYTRIRKLARLITFLTIVLLALVFVPGIGHTSLGVRRWVGPVSLHLQPSELAVVGVLIYLSYIFDKNSAFTQRFFKGVMPPLMILGLQFSLIMIEPDMGTAMLLLASGLSVMFAAGIRKRHIMALFLLLTPIVIGLVFLKSYRSHRLVSFFHGSYQMNQSLIAIWSGGLFGKGIGQGIQSFGYLPVPQADFIFSIIVEELGLLGASVILILFGILVWRGIKIGLTLENRFASLLALGISCMIAIGVLINVSAATGIIPITGIPLPFISYGGTAMVVKLIAMGLLLSLSRYTVTTPSGVKSPVRAQDKSVRQFPQPGSKQYNTKANSRKKTALPKRSVTADPRKG